MDIIAVLAPALPSLFLSNEKPLEIRVLILTQPLTGCVTLGKLILLSGLLLSL